MTEFEKVANALKSMEKNPELFDKILNNYFTNGPKYLIFKQKSGNLILTQV
jgi:hypothetical protein